MSELRGITLTLFSSYQDVQPKGLTLSLEEAQNFFHHKHKPGACFSMAQYRPGGRRCGADVTHMTGVVLDFDVKTPMSPQLASQAMASVLKPIREKDLVHFWYTTKSHRPESPRWRVVLPLGEPVMERAWSHSWGKTCRWLKSFTSPLVQEALDPCSAHPTQMFLLPGAFPL